MITFDGIIFTAGSRLGGVSVYFRELISQSVLASEELRVLVHDPSMNAAELRCAPEQVWYRAPRRLERYRSLKGVPPGILHSSYYRVTRDMGVRNVVTVYDFSYEKFVTGPRAWVHTAQKRHAVLNSDAVICISHNTKRDLQKFIPEYPADKIFVTHLAAADWFKPVQGAATRLTDLPFALFVGGRSDYKNFAGAVQALSRTPEVALVCVGGGAFTPQERGHLEALLPGRFFHAGPVKVTELNELYNAAVCLLYPSLYEGFGIPPLEAMQAGCPFVALDTSSIPEVAGDAGILVPEPDPELLAAAIRKCADAQSRVALRKLGFEQAKKFSWRRTFEDTLPVYRRLLEIA